MFLNQLKIILIQINNMYCENCGNKMDSTHKFCIKCGHTAATSNSANSSASIALSVNEKWWHRFLKVLYIILYIPLLVILPVVWSINSSSYNYYSSSSTDTSGTAFWYCLLTLVIYMAVVRLIKIAVLYVALGKKPEWKKEFKRLF